MKKFRHLNLPTQWEQYWSKYPNGYSIMEALIDWVSQVDDMVDNQNVLSDTVSDYRIELDEFIGRFDGRLQDEVVDILKYWQDTGLLDVVIDQALDTKYHEMDDRLTAQMAQTQRVANVKAFGATGDGQTDDTTAIRLARASIEETGGVLYFPKGYYRITDSVTITDNIEVRGESMNSTFMLPDVNTMNTPTTNKPCFRTAQQSKNISFKDISVDGSNTDQTVLNTALFFSDYAMENFKAENIKGVNALQLFRIRDCKGMSFQNIFYDKPTIIEPMKPGNVISLIRCVDVVISHVIAYDTTEIIDLALCSYVTINNVVGESQYTDDEAIDIGGCNHVVISNVITKGYQLGIHIKNEGEHPYIYSQNIQVNDCKFTEFMLAGVRFTTNIELDDFTVKNIQFNNCTFKSSVPNVIGFLQNSTTINYGILNLMLKDCVIETDNRAINIESIKDFSVDGCVIKSDTEYSIVRLTPNTNFPFPEKRENYVFRDSTIIGLKADVGIEATNIHGLSLLQTNIHIKLTGSNSVSCVNVKNPRIEYSQLTGGTQSIHLLWTNQTYLNQVMKTVNAVINHNRIDNFGVRGIRVNIDLPEIESDSFKLIVVSNNTISLDETQVLDSQTAIQFRTRRVTGGLDYVKCDHNLIYNVPVGIGYDQATFGENSTTVNNTIFNG